LSNSAVNFNSLNDQSRWESRKQNRHTHTTAVLNSYRTRQSWPL